MLNEMDLTGYKKVAENGGTFVTATFFNPETGDVVTGCVRDYDYADGSRDIDELYHMGIDEEARRAWLHTKGIILAGDTIEVIKGRKVKVGTVAVVTKTREIKDRYGRWVADYVVLDNGEQTNIDNCRLVG